MGLPRPLCKLPFDAGVLSGIASAPSHWRTWAIWWWVAGRGAIRSCQETWDDSLAPRAQRPRWGPPPYTCMVVMSGVGSGRPQDGDGYAEQGKNTHVEEATAYPASSPPTGASSMYLLVLASTWGWVTNDSGPRSMRSQPPRQLCGCKNKTYPTSFPKLLEISMYLQG